MLPLVRPLRLFRVLRVLRLFRAGVLFRRRVSGFTEGIHTQGGEFLALVAPNGRTVIDSFEPTYPPLLDDFSYGTRMGATLRVSLPFAPLMPSHFSTMAYRAFSLIGLDR